MNDSVLEVRQTFNDSNELVVTPALLRNNYNVLLSDNMSQFLLARITS